MLSFSSLPIPILLPCFVCPGPTLAQAGPPQGPNLHLPKSTPKPLALGEGGGWEALLGWSWIPVLPGEAAGREQRLSWNLFVFMEAKTEEVSMESESFYIPVENRELIPGAGGLQTLPGSGIPPAGSSTCALGRECWWRES